MHNLLLFSAREDYDARKKILHDHSSYETILQHTYKLDKRVKQNVSERLSENFALLFDVFYLLYSHLWYISSKQRNDHEYFLIALTPFGKEQSKDTEEHFFLCQFTLSSYCKQPNNCVALIDNICATNIDFSRNFQGGFNGCVFHQSNLAVKDLLEEHYEIIEAVYSITREIRAPNRRAALRELIDLTSIVMDVTWRFSSFEMLKR